MKRRDVLPLLGGALLAGTLPSPGPASESRAGGDAGAALDPLLTHVRMRGHPDGRAVYWWYAGTFYGQVSGQRTVPLLRVEGMSINRCRPQPDGSYAYSLREAGWFSDLDTGVVLDTWQNPLTSRTVAPRHYYSPQELRFAGRTVTPVLSAPIPGLEFDGLLSVPMEQGGSVWSGEELLVRVTGTTGAVRVQTSLLTLHTSLSDLSQPVTQWVPATMAYQTLASWLPWMDMGDIPGVISWRLAGRKAAAPDALPAGLVRRVRDQHPQLFEG